MCVSQSHSLSLSLFVCLSFSVLPLSLSTCVSQSLFLYLSVSHFPVFLSLSMCVSQPHLPSLSLFVCLSSCIFLSLSLFLFQMYEFLSACMMAVCIRVKDIEKFDKKGETNENGFVSINHETPDTKLWCRAGTGVILKFYMSFLLNCLKE